jgi:hypothetical protein
VALVDAGMRAADEVLTTLEGEAGGRPQEAILFAAGDEGRPASRPATGVVGVQAAARAAFDILSKGSHAAPPESRGG